MHIRMHGLPVLGLAILLLWATTAADAQQQGRPAVVDGLPDMIPIQLLLGNAKYRNPQLDNNGSYVSYIRPDSNGVMNIFVQQLPTGPQLKSLQRNASLLDQRSDAERQITFDTKRGVSSYSWAEDDSTIFYLQDTGGDENFHLYMVSIRSLVNSSSSSNGNSSNGSKAAAAAAAVTQDLTPFPGVKVQGIITNERVPRKIFFGMNKRDPTIYDLYSVNLDTREIALHTVNPGDVSNWLVDFDFELRGVENYNSTDGSTYVQVNDNLPLHRTRKNSSSSSSSSSSSKNAAVSEEKGTKPSSSSSSSSSDRAPMPVQELFAAAAAAAAAGNWTLQQWIDASVSRSDVSQWRVLLRWPFGEDSSVLRFNRAGDAIYGTSAEGRDTTEFVLYSTAPGAKILQRIAGSNVSNVNSVTFKPTTWEPQAVSFNYLRPRWVFLDPAFKEMWDKLVSFHPNRDPSISSRSYDSKTWIITYTADNATTAMYLYKPGTWPPQLLLEMQPELNKFDMANMHTVVIPARDGLALPAYLTLPRKPGVPTVLPACVVGNVPDLRPSAQEAIDSSPLKCPLDIKVPLVLYVHGGPWARDTWGADSIVQFLANRGYAVLQVNYRGSTSYGRNFSNAGKREWGVGKMQHDLTDSVRWAIEKGIADPSKVCIWGASYGGYATLAGLVFTPQLYVCGVDLVGVSNVATFLKSIPPYWKPLRIDFVNRVGDAEANATLNQEISPVFHARNIQAPLLIGQGMNDPRVAKAESDQMFRAMKSKGLDVEYILYPDEGHGLVRPDNRLDFYSHMEQFLAKHLGGRAAPLLKPPGSSAQVITSA